MLVYIDIYFLNFNFLVKKLVRKGCSGQTQFNKFVLIFCWIRKSEYDTYLTGQGANTSHMSIHDHFFFSLQRQQDEAWAYSNMYTNSADILSFHHYSTAISYIPKVFVFLPVGLNWMLDNETLLLNIEKIITNFFFKHIVQYNTRCVLKQVPF